MTQFLPDRRIKVMQNSNSKEYIVKESFDTTHRKLLEKLIHSELKEYAIPKEEKETEHPDGKTEFIFELI